MEAVLSQPRAAITLAACAVGIAVAWLTATPFGLLAPMATLLLLARGPAALVLQASTAIGLAGSLLVAAFYAGAGAAVAMTWAAFFAAALCIGAVLATNASASPKFETPRVPIRSTTSAETPSYPAVGPTLEEKSAPRHSPLVSVAAEDASDMAALMAAASFWTGNPVHIRYWQRRSDGSHRWTEVRSQAFREPSGTQRWSSAVSDIDDQRPTGEPPAKMAYNPPSEDDAVRAAKIVERVFGNSWAFDAAGRPTYLTPAGQTFVALTLADFQAAVDEGHTFFKRTAHPDDYARLDSAWRHCLKTGEDFFIERRIRRASGIYEWSRTAFVPTRDIRGRITGWYGTTMDLDAYRVTEAALRERERELSQLVDMVPSHIWRLAPDGEPVFFNRRMSDFLGFGVSGADPRSAGRLDAIIDAVHPADAAAFRSILGNCLATGEVFSMRYRLLRVDGVYRWMSSRAEPIRDDGGRIVQWYGLCHDIDDQMQIEDTLRERERELSQLVDMVPVHIRRLTPQGEPTFFNKRLIDFLGLDIVDVGKPGMSRLAAAIQAYVHPDDAAGLSEAIHRSLATGRGYAMRYRMRRADGVYRWMEGRAEPLRNQDETIVQWYAITIDIDDEVRARQTEEALRLASEKLARASQAASLAELSASIAHEVNQPLAAIVANSHACQRWLTAEPPNIERARTTVERIIRDANSASDVLNRIRALFKQSPETRTATTLGSVISEVRDLIAEEAARRQVRLDIDVESDIPLIAFDRVQVQQVLINLLRNGIEAMDSTTGERVLGIRVRRVGDAVQTEVSDRGRGIALPDRIFEPFFTTKEDGMGMGLAICRSIVESHGGRLWAEERQPQGATFVFTLPIEADSSS